MTKQINNIEIVDSEIGTYSLSYEGLPKKTTAGPSKILGVPALGIAYIQSKHTGVNSDKAVSAYLRGLVEKDLGHKLPDAAWDNRGKSYDTPDERQACLVKVNGEFYNPEWTTSQLRQQATAEAEQVVAQPLPTPKIEMPTPQVAVQAPQVVVNAPVLPTAPVVAQPTLPVVEAPVIALTDTTKAEDTIAMGKLIEIFKLMSAKDESVKGYTNEFVKKGTMEQFKTKGLGEQKGAEIYQRALQAYTSELKAKQAPQAVVLPSLL